MYEKALGVISKKVPNFKPKHIISDFEIGAINAAKKVFPGAQMHGCFFHFCQTIWRHVQAVGLQIRYNNDAMFALNIRQLMALAFVPAQDIESAFTRLCQSEFWTDNEEKEDNGKVQELLAYFEKTYIGAPSRNGRRKNPLFDPSLWSVYEVTILGKEI